MKRVFYLVFLVVTVGLMTIHGEELSLLTLNTWQLPVFSKHPHYRLKALPNALAKSQADIIALQEVWSCSVRKKLIWELKKRGYPYVAYKNRKRGLNLRLPLLGNGLVIFSKYPFLRGGNVDQLVYSSIIEKDEIFALKGAIHVVIEVKGFGVIDLYNTHMGAASFPKDALKWERQKKELDAFVAKTKSLESALIVTMGDFNWPLKEDPQALPTYGKERLDHILIEEKRGDRTLKKSFHLFDQKLSDHLGVFVQLY